MSNQKFKLVHKDHPVLRMVADPVEDREIGTLRGQMYWLDKLRKHLKGAAIAGPQLGDKRRWFIWPLGLVINPKIVVADETTSKVIESCLSFPGLGVPVERPNKISVVYTNEYGTKTFTMMDGQTARVFQHELDHLQGICIDTK